MGNFYFLSAFLHISNSLQWICITVIICKRLVLKFIWNYNFMVVILQSKLFCLHVEFSFLPFFLCAFPHLYFYCPAFSALIDQLSSPVRHSGCTGLSDVCIENDLNSTRHAGAVSWPPRTLCSLAPSCCSHGQVPHFPLTNPILHFLPLSVKNSVPVRRLTQLSASIH